ncbi:MAG TPA: MFS transporter [Sphingomicrobium sp.]|jgi:predicted MFS family arabinose efflux permease|nr:MFS transporter [Sphingomicrobium sp.]
MENVAAIADSEHRRSASPESALAILFLVVTVNLFDRQLINILAQDIKLDLSLTDAELGLLTGTAFGALKAAFSVPIGAWADRSSRPRILGGLIAVCSLCSMICSVSRGFVGLGLARMGVGIGESAGVPIATAMLRDYFPRRSTSAIAIAMAGNPVGTFLAFLVGGFIAARWGWRWAFFAAGPLGLVLAWVIVSKLRDTGVPVERKAMGASWVSEALELVRRPLLVPLMAGTASSMFVVVAASAWMPAFLIRVHSLGTAQAGLWSALAVGIGGALGTLSGAACDLMRPRIRFPESAMLLGTLLMLPPFLFVMVFAKNAMAAVSSYLLYNVLAYSWTGPTIRLIQDSVAPRERALATALCSATGMFVGLGVGIPLIGWLSDHLAADYGSRSIGVALSIVVSFAIAIGLASHLVVVNRLAAIARTPLADLDKSASSLANSGKP